MPKQQQIRAFCFTINNYSSDEWANLPKLYEEGYCKYLVAGKEIGEECKTPHIQGYVYFNGRGYSMKSAHKLPGLARAALLQAKGTPQQNQSYCTKQGDYIELGEKPAGQGKRTDIDQIKEIVKSGGNMRQIIDKSVSYQCLKTGELLLKYQKAPERPHVKVYWYYGPSGTGKTTTARAEAGEDYWISSDDLKYWDDYDGQRNVIIDDYRTDFCTFHKLLRILDKQPYKCNTKHGHRALYADNIWVTAPKHPEEMWASRTPEQLFQLTRRISVIREFKPEDVSQKSGVI